RGDPTFSEAFSEDQPYKRFDELADAIVAAGVKTVSGSIVGDETFFNTAPIPFGWEWDDLQWYYGAEISSLSIFDNAIELKVLPSTAGAQCVVQTTPLTRFVRIINKTTTVAPGGKRRLRVTKLLGQNVIEVAGNMPENDKGYSGRVAFSKPSELFAEVLSNRLRMKGVNIKGGIRAIDREDRGGTRLPVESYKEIASTFSPPLSIIAAKTMKPSQNLYTELLLRTLGETVTAAEDTETTSDKKGIDAVQKLLGRAGVEPRSVVQYDGSGLSRHNLITPDSAVKLYLYMDRGNNSIVWRNALTIGGVDGTLRNRFKGTSAEGNVRGKTGTLDQVSALSGYVNSKSGERFVFSVLTNYIPNSRLRTSTIDKIVVLLADYDGVL
ncbi:MAG: D-alanyl-D-alanine carboxypeptidase/D-alanyl-D-alanine-endopeptidase, partial [Acidobacteriota bacterium]|nr:D-alanyl-D-alanine carboxypeptidase/D-alanyl-D-alanine-endopeptidase [Acidobacteriota bacterium]